MKGLYCLHMTARWSRRVYDLLCLLHVNLVGELFFEFFINNDQTLRFL